MTGVPRPSAATMATAIRPEQLGRVAVLLGGESAEREISLRSGQGVLAALHRCGVEAIGFDPAERALHELTDESVDRVFIALHGRFGEDGTVQGALELLKIPYTGSGVLASSLAMDKPMTKRIWQSYQLPTPAWWSVSRSPHLPPDQRTDLDPAAIHAALGLPLAVKPAREGSSLGFCRVDHLDALSTAVEAALRLDDTVIIETFVDGREFTCALLEDSEGQVQALPVIEIVAPSGQYDYQNKYFGSATRYLCPAPLSADVEAHMRALSVQAFETVGARGWARVDLMWVAGQEPMLLEINTSPGMTDHSLVPMAAAQAGLSYDALVLHITAQASLKLEHSR